MKRIAAATAWFFAGWFAGSFIAFAAEERGLLGSAFYVRNAPFPIENTIAMLNLDMVGRSRGSVDVSGLETGPALEGDLADAMRRAEAAHGEHEKRTGVRDEEWPTWYATYMIAEQHGRELPT